MKNRVLAVLSAVFTVALLTPLPSAGQNAPARTPDGHPDLQGVWDFRTITPLERPDELAGQEVLTDEEAATFEQETYRRQNRDLIDPATGGANYPPESQGGVVPYNEFWYDRGTRVVESRRTSLIVDPADGRIPYISGARRGRGRGAGGGRGSDTWTDRSLWERCLSRELPRMSGAYNNNMQIFQAADHVVIFNEMVHEARIIPLDGPAHLAPNIRQLQGDSRGHWEGDTLVVDTTNFTDQTNFRGSREDLYLVERFTRGDDDTLLYEFTVEDSTAWTQPWTAAFDMARLDGQMYEYACHEANRGMIGLLAGARVQEMEAAKAGGR
jgi:hypothetical protein